MKQPSKPTRFRANAEPQFFALVDEVIGHITASKQALESRPVAHGEDRKGELIQIFSQYPPGWLGAAYGYILALIREKALDQGFTRDQLQELVKAVPTPNGEVDLIIDRRVDFDGKGLFEMARQMKKAFQPMLLPTELQKQVPSEGIVIPLVNATFQIHVMHEVARLHGVKPPVVITGNIEEGGHKKAVLLVQKNVWNQVLENEGMAKAAVAAISIEKPSRWA